MTVTMVVSSQYLFSWYVFWWMWGGGDNFCIYCNPFFLCVRTSS